jgi:peroxiredoxin
VVVFSTLGLPDDPKEAGCAREYQLLLQEYKEALRLYGEAEKRAESPESRKALLATFPKPTYQDRFVALARKYPGDPHTIGALTWVLKNPWQGDRAEANVKEALEILRRDFLRHSEIGLACEALAYPVTTRKAAGGLNPAAERLLRDVLEQNPHREAQGRACYSLATYLSFHSRWRSAGMPEKEAERASQEAMALYRRVLEAYADLPAPYRGTLGVLAQAELFEMTSLVVGKVAPEIEGKDIKGDAFRLTDYRGKVVLLTFSGNWCGPCRAMYQQERALTERLRDRPFALLSVNTDTNVKTLETSIASGEITWRCWCDGGTDGPITTRWGVETFPTLYLIDQKGVIQKKGYVKGDELERAVDELLAK